MCVERDILLTMLEEAMTGLRVAEAHICQAGHPPEERAELRGREKAYRVHVDQLRRAIAQLDRLGTGSAIEGAIANIEAAARLLEEVRTTGYKSQYSLGVCRDSLTGSKRAFVGLWNVISEEAK